MSNQLVLLTEQPCLHAEGPQWLPATNQLLWVDIDARKVHLLHVDTSEHKVIELPQRVGVAVPTEDGSILCGLEDGIYRWNEHELTLLAELESDIPDHRCNDGKVDPAGRFWVGTMPMSFAAWSGALYSCDAGGNIHKHVEQLGCSNGMDWNTDGKTMYFIDSPTKRVDAFDYDIETGKIANRRPVINFDDSLGVPDGMCSDADNRLWVAHWGGYAVTCWDSTTGEKLAHIELPVSNVTSCCFGGPDLTTLFITTSRQGLTEEQLKEQPLAGSVFKIEVEAKGKINPIFKLR